MPETDHPPTPAPTPHAPDAGGTTRPARLAHGDAPARPARLAHGDAPARHPARSSRFAAARDAVTFVLAVLGGLLGLYQFWYVNIYQEGQLPPEITLAASLQPVGHQGGFRALQATITMHNASKTRVYALASWFNVVGSRIAADHLSDRDYQAYVQGGVPLLADAPGSVNSMPRDWHEAADQSRVVNCGQFLDGGYWFEPDEDYTAHFLIYVPDSARYDQVRLEADTCITKDEDHARAALQAGPTGALVAQTQVRSDHPDRWTTLGPDVDLSTQKQATRYGVGEVENEYELSLWGSAPPAPPSQP